MSHAVPKSQDRGTTVKPQRLPGLCVNVHADVEGGLVEESFVSCVAEELDLVAAL